MKYVVVDLEMNPIQRKFKEEKKICKMETIQIGAVALDERFQEISSFSTLIKPEYNEGIEKRYEEITGISTEMVQNAPHFKKGMEQFLAWCSNLEDEIEFLQWSENDLWQIEREMELKELLFEPYASFLSNWSDFQSEFATVLGFNRQLSLSDALNYARLPFIGTQHNALYDARNTSELFKIIRDAKSCEELCGFVLETHQPKRSTYTLGEMFDFSKFYS